jgi:hypothetical protein
MNIIIATTFMNELIDLQPFFSSPFETYPAKTGIKEDAIAPPISIEYIKSGILKAVLYASATFERPFIFIGISAVLTNPNTLLSTTDVIIKNTVLLNLDSFNIYPFKRAYFLNIFKA